MSVILCGTLDWRRFVAFEMLSLNRTLVVTLNLMSEQLVQSRAM